jgi:hypothetical protein
MENQPEDPLRGLTAEDQRIMNRLLRMPPEQQKVAPKPTGNRAEAQRRRREREKARKLT